MDEVLGDFRQIVVDDLGDVVHVNPARGQISRYEDADTPLLESGECRGALRLRTPAVNHGRSEAFAVQAESQAFASALGAREDENSALILSQQAAQHIEFAIGGDFESLHANVFGGPQHRAQLDANRMTHIVVNQMRNRGFESGGEAEGLAILRKNGNNPANRGKKSHVQHAIGFVEDEHAQRLEGYEPAIEKVLETSGRSHDDASSLTQCVELAPLGQAADDKSRWRQL